MGEIRSYKDMDVWNCGMDLSVLVYQLARRLPPEEKYALGDQMRRAVTSIPTNIAEGHNRGFTKEYIHFLYIAKGSNAEVYTQLLLGCRLGYFTHEQIDETIHLCTRVGQMLNSLIDILKRKDKKAGNKSSSEDD